MTSTLTQVDIIDELTDMAEEFGLRCHLKDLDQLGHGPVVLDINAGPAGGFHVRVLVHHSGSILLDGAPATIYDVYDRLLEAPRLDL